MRRKITRWRLLLLLLAMMLPAAACAAELQVHQMTLGVADGYLLCTENTTILIDAGRDTGHTADMALDYLREMGVEAIDVHILTHYHADHAGNVQEISAAFYTPETVVYGPSDAFPEAYAPLPQGHYQPMKMGDRLVIDDVEFLCTAPIWLKKNGWDNVDSLNILVTCGQRRFLFTGDYMPGESIKHFREELRNVDVLKFPHHGMRPLCMPDWAIKHVRAKVILIPGLTRMHVSIKVGDMDMNPKILAMNNEHVVILTDGDKLEVRTEVPRKDALGQTL